MNECENAGKIVHLHQVELTEYIPRYGCPKISEAKILQNSQEKICIGVSF